MIGKARRGSGFGGLYSYLHRGDRAEWTSTRNLVYGELEQVPAIMRATADMNDRVEKPVYHLVVSLADGESLSRERWDHVADRVLTRLGLENHQALLVLHKDTEHEHIHVMVNRVDLDGRVWKGWRDWVGREAELRNLEKELGLQQVQGPRFLRPNEPLDRTEDFTSGEIHQARRTGDAAFVEKIRREAGHHFREAQSWADLAARIHPHGLRLEARGRGLVVTDGEQMVKASRIDRDSSRGALEARLGDFREWSRDAGQIRDHFDRDDHREHVKGQWQKTARITERFDERIHHFRALLDQAAVSEYKLDKLLKTVYRGDDARAVSERLQRAAWVKPDDVARRLEHEPESFGRVRGQALGPFQTPARADARDAAAEAARELVRLQQLRQEIRGLEPRVPALERRAAGLREHARKLAFDIHDRLPTDDALRHLGRLVLRHGEREVREMLRPVVTPLRIARAIHEGTLGRTVANYAAGKLLGPAAGPILLIERAVGLVRSIGRDRERGMEREPQPASPPAKQGMGWQRGSNRFAVRLDHEADSLDDIAKCSIIETADRFTKRGFPEV
jgi:hypothetical protein